MKISKKRRNIIICSVTEPNILLPSSFSGLPPHSYNTKVILHLDQPLFCLWYYRFFYKYIIGQYCALDNIVPQDFSLSQDIFQMTFSFS